jgi:hypothetical protein
MPPLSTRASLRAAFQHELPPPRGLAHFELSRCSSIRYAAYACLAKWYTTSPLHPRTIVGILSLILHVRLSATTRQSTEALSMYLRRYASKPSRKVCSTRALLGIWQRWETESRDYGEGEGALSYALLREPCGVLEAEIQCWAEMCWTIEPCECWEAQSRGCEGSSWTGKPLQHFSCNDHFKLESPVGTGEPGREAERFFGGLGCEGDECRRGGVILDMTELHGGSRGEDRCREGGMWALRRRVLVLGGVVLAGGARRGLWSQSSVLGSVMRSLSGIVELEFSVGRVVRGLGGLAEAETRLGRVILDGEAGEWLRGHGSNHSEILVGEGGCRLCQGKAREERAMVAMLKEVLRGLRRRNRGPQRHGAG